MTKERVRLQLAEALGHDNRWYCSNFHRKPIDDPELLLRYFVASGGAADFAARFDHAMSDDNRWYCSQFYGYEVRDTETLWRYYMDYASARVDRCEEVELSSTY